MQQFVSITSQGQISIPAQMRKALGLSRYNKALIRQEHNRLIIEPAPDLLALGGSLRDIAITDKTVDEVQAIEKQAVADGFAKKAT